MIYDLYGFLIYFDLIGIFLVSLFLFNLPRRIDLSWGPPHGFPSERSFEDLVQAINQNFPSAIFFFLMRAGMGILLFSGIVRLILFAII